MTIDCVDRRLNMGSMSVSWHTEAFGSTSVRHVSYSEGQPVYAARGFRVGIWRCWQLAWAAKSLRVSWCSHARNLLSLTRKIWRRRRQRTQKLCTSIWRCDDPSVPNWRRTQSLSLQRLGSSPAQSAPRAHVCTGLVLLLSSNWESYWWLSCHNRYQFTVMTRVQEKSRG